MACTGIGPYTWYLYDENWNLIDCVDNSLTSYSFSGITGTGIYNVTVVHDGQSVTTQFEVTGNETCCWDVSLYQPCNESCNQLTDALSMSKNGDDYQITVNQNYGAVDIFFKKINNILGFNSTHNISSTPPDISILYSSEVNKGVNVYFESLIRSYACCDIEPGDDILFTAPCLNDPIYKVIKFCNTCDETHSITGFTFDICNPTCPDGYTWNSTGHTCDKCIVVSATIPSEFVYFTLAPTSLTYGPYGTNFYPDISNYSLPIINDFADLTNYMIDANGVKLTADTNIQSTFWGDSISYDGRLNNMGIWLTTPAEPLYTWIGFNKCITIPFTGNYFIGFASDDYLKISIDNTLYFVLSGQSSGPVATIYNYSYWQVFPISLTEGDHQFIIQGYNDNKDASFAFEIYSATTLETLTAATNIWETGIVWTTWLMNGETANWSGISGYTCPDGYTFSNCSGASICTYCESASLLYCNDNWDVRFLHYTGDCDSRELVEFDPNTEPLFLSGTCDTDLYPYSECKCFYVAIGYRSDEINDHYTGLNLFLSDNSSTGSKTISYNLHGRAPSSYQTIIPTIFGSSILTTLGNDCPDKPGCDCLTIASQSNTNDNDGYPTSIGGVSYYQFEKTYTITNSCYTEFNLQYGYITPSYSGLTVDYSNFNGVLGKNETATLTLTYLSTNNVDLSGTIGYSASTTDPFICIDPEIECNGILNFSFTALPVPLSFSNTPYNFGSIGDGCCGESTFNLYNNSTSSIDIVNLVLTNSFFEIVSPTNLPTAILGYGSLELIIRFCPSGCTDGTVHTSDIIITTSDYGTILGSTLTGGFALSGTCVDPPISASTDSLVFIKHVDEQLSSGLTICNRTSVDQTVDISNCVQFVSGATSDIVDPLDYGFEIVIQTDVTIDNTLTYPRYIDIAANSCTDLIIRYDMEVPNRTFCSIYLRDDCGNVTEIPFTGYSLPYPIGISNIEYTNPVCYGDTNGTITISFTGGAAPYIYVFSGNGTYETGTVYGGVLTFTNLTATETGTDYIFSLSGDPCDGSGTIPDLSPFIVPTSPEVILYPSPITTLIQPPYLEITETSYTGKTCVSLASASVTITGGTTPYIFTWSNGTAQTGNTTPSTATISNLDTGTYGVAVQDFNGCSKYENIVIPSLLPIHVTTQTTSVSCYGGVDGYANLTLTNAVPVVTYYWSGQTYDDNSAYPSHYDTYTSTTANMLTAGTYFVSYEDGNGCTGYTNFNVLQPKELGFYASSTNVTCPYLANGTITFYPITGGTYPYTVYASGDTIIYSSSTSQTLTNVDGGDYNAYVIDHHGCQAPNQLITITKPDPFIYTFDYTATTCYNSSDGHILLSVSGGTPPYSYFWNPSEPNSEYINGLAHGNYNINVFDSNGCTFFTGMTLPYTTSHCSALYLTDIYGNLIPNIGGEYQITMSHTCLNNVSAKTIKLCQNSPCTFNILSYSGISTTISDFYLGGEILNLSIPSSGCTNISLVFNPTSAQTYTTNFSITTEYCTYYFSLSGTGVENIISADTTSIDFGNICFGTADTRYLTILNLTPDNRAIYVQTIPSEFSSISAFILSGNSSVTVPYVFTPTYPLTNPVIWQKEFLGTTSLTDCPTMVISLSGTGYGGNLYVSGLNFGCVNKNCYRDETATIYNYHCLPVNISGVTIPSYYNGILTVFGFTPTTIPAGGTSTFNVRYSATTTLVSFMAVTTDFSLASLLVSGITACMVDTLGGIDPIIPIITTPGVADTSTVSISNITSTNLFIAANITNLTGGTPTNVTVAPPIIALPAPVLPATATTNTFTITFNDPAPIVEWFNFNLTDNCGNHITIPFFVSSTAIGYSNATITNPSCNGYNNGSIVITPSGGTSPYTIVWDIGITGDTITNLSADTYTSTIYDFYWNSDTFSFTLTEPNALGISHTVPFNGSYNILVYSANTGYVDITVVGGTLPYSYYWSGYTYQGASFSSTLEDITGLTAGNYLVTVTDANGCQISDFASLNQPNPITIVINNCTPPVPPSLSCTITGGTANISVSGGQCPYSIIVCPTVPQNPLFAAGGPYYGLTTCQILPDCSVVSSGTPCITSTCYCCDDSLYPCVSGSCPCTHCDIIISNLPPGNYPPGTFGVIDVNSGTTVYVVPTFVPNPSTLGFVLSQIPATCNGQSNGSLTVTIVPTMNQLGQYGMGVPPYTYFLDGVQQGLPTTDITQTYNGLSSNYHTITVEDNDSNIVTNSIFVGQGRVSASISIVSETLQEGNGSITINTISGGIGPYTATINSNTPVTIYGGYVFSNLSAGSYLIEIVDSLGCRFSIKPVISRFIPMEEGQKLIGAKTPVSNPTIYEKRLGGFKLINKKK